MEKITRYDGVYYYGGERCRGIDDAYSKFREAVHAEAGRRSPLRLDRLGSRKERVHGYGFVFERPLPDNDSFSSRIRTRCHILGFLGIGYVRSIGCWDYADIGEEEFDSWLDWVFTKGRGALRVVGNRDRVGRTSRRLHARYR